MTRTLLFLSAVSALAGAMPAHAASAADRAFVAKVSQGGMFEVAAGRLAETKGSTPDIRDFGWMEVHDHSIVGNNLKRITAADGLPVDADLNADFTAKLQELAALSGPAFDAAYMRQMAALHDADGAAFAQEATAGSSEAYRTFGKETHRIVQRHIGAIRAVPTP